MIDLPLVLSPLTPADMPALERLDARAFGPGRFARSAYRLREGVAPDFTLSFVARVGTLLVGANRMTPVMCADQPALLLGPLTVETAFHKRGIGAALVQHSLEAARTAGHKLVILVGDLPYYSRFGFVSVKPGQLRLPGPVDPARLLACELEANALGAIGIGVLVRGHI